jgi:NAD(P)-dependent dehydrogenase (short-subunit alcohol dehydrogenase family)
LFASARCFILARAGAVEEANVTSKVIVITGGFGALGRSVVEAAVAEGRDVAALDVAPAPPESLVQAVGSKALLLPSVDLLSLEGARRALADVAARFGRIDAIVNLAGGFVSESIEDGAVETWDKMFDLNLKTALNACKAALPYLTDSEAGRIVNVGAGPALRAGAGLGAYAASKAGVLRLTESLAEELKPKGITVNAVLPSIIDTPANRASMPKADFSRWVAPRDLASVILFLASEAARAVTGALLPVTGRL